MDSPELLRRIGIDAAKQSRWSDGFGCSRCDADEHWDLGEGAGWQFQAYGRRLQTTLTAASLMDHAKLPLTAWILAAHLIRHAAICLSALVLKPRLSVSYALSVAIAPIDQWRHSRAVQHSLPGRHGQT
jgi:hypothetical protein